MKQAKHPKFRPNQTKVEEILALVPQDPHRDTFDIKIQKGSVIPECETAIVCPMCQNVFLDPIACGECSTIACKKCI